MMVQFFRMDLILHRLFIIKKLQSYHNVTARVQLRRWGSTVCYADPY